MKKIIAFFLVFMLVFIGVGCNKKQDKLTVATPDGAPSMAIAKMMKDDKSYNYSVVSGTEIQAIFTKGEIDFVIAPTNAGMMLSLKNNNYKIVATTSWGNLYLLTTDSDYKTLDECSSAQEFLQQFAGKKIDSIGINQVPDKTFKTMLQQVEVQATLNGSEASLIQAGLKANTTDLAILGEPAVTATKGAVTNCKELCSLSALWKQIFNMDFPQASLFVKSSLSDSKVQKFLTKLQDSIEYLNASQDNAYELGVYMENSGISTLKGAIVKKSYLKMNQKFELALSKKQDIIKFIESLGVTYNDQSKVFYGENN